MESDALEPPKSLTADVIQAAKECDAAVSALNAVTGSTRGKYRRKRLKRSRTTPKSSKKSSVSSNNLPERKVTPPEKLTESEVDIKLRAMVNAAQPGETFTLQEIAEVMGVSRERVRQIQDKALRKVYFHLAKVARADGIDMEELKR